jgi:hypothetical protein
MFCDQCGNQNEQNANFCSVCGKALLPVNRQSPLIGYSTKINDPAFKKYKSKSKIWSIAFSLIIAVIAIVAFPIYGNKTGEVDFPQSLYYGMAIGGMFVLIALLQTLKRGLDKTWDGVVTEKKSYRKRVNDSNDNSGVVRHETVYVVKVKKNNGGSKKHKFINLPGVYNYYNENDHVRHHKGFTYYEKYDKSRDAQIMCAACLTFNDINNENCSRCKCPLLK